MFQDTRPPDQAELYGNPDSCHLGGLGFLRGGKGIWGIDLQDRAEINKESLARAGRKGVVCSVGRGRGRNLQLRAGVKPMVRARELSR